jgi:hypothetical protein
MILTVTTNVVEISRGFLATADFPGLMGTGKSPQEALNQLAIKSHFEVWKRNATLGMLHLIPLSEDELWQKQPAAIVFKGALNVVIQKADVLRAPMVK